MNWCPRVPFFGVWFVVKWIGGGGVLNRHAVSSFRITLLLGPDISCSPGTLGYEPRSCSSTSKYSFETLRSSSISLQHYN
jgi:hypothetical protein